MLVRRLTYALCAVILIGVVAAAIVRREQRDTQAVSPATTGQAVAPAVEVTATLPPDRVVRARVGDIVSLAVRSPEPDRATIPAIGVSAVTSADLPGTLQFVATQAGRFPIVFEVTHRPAGDVVVSAGG